MASKRQNMSDKSSKQEAEKAGGRGGSGVCMSLPVDSFVDQRPIGELVRSVQQKTNMRLISIPFVLLVCFHVPSTSGAIKCEADHECPTDHYCYKVAGNCSPCINCGTYKRKNSTWQSCTHSVTECEDCLPGYEKEIMTDRKIREKCVPQPKASHFNKSEGVKARAPRPNIESGIDEVSDGVGAESISLVPHAPPPYTEASMYSNNGDCQCKEVSECLNHTMEVRMEKEDLHQAVPFRDADEHSDTNEIT
ncbi:hypothetical protein AAG570_005641 [Ranatra chinensis]|uniref:TNFR-Cys domain-containing protein n=1 Tax=Ranatra chinensis TaxID=642074 RepID=A0ABD0XY41_9HEMI